jgi:hypothetical protein
VDSRQIAEKIARAAVNKQTINKVDYILTFFLMFVKEYRNGFKAELIGRLKTATHA